MLFKGGGLVTLGMPPPKRPCNNSRTVNIFTVIPGGCHSKKKIVTLLLLPVSDQPIINDWSRWFAISRLPPICSPSFNFTGGVGGGKKLNLNVQNNFAESHTETTTLMKSGHNSLSLIRSNKSSPPVMLKM
jgi:hypothetical protein